MIYISTVAFKDLDIYQILQIAEEENLAIEFSSGLPYMEYMEAIYKNTTINRLPHNYFPAPITPFVLNLASSDKLIRWQSINMCKKGLSLAKQSESPFYAAHAGFCTDPNPKELGKKITITERINHSLHWEIFINSVKEVLNTATELNVDFYIENNVIAKFNMVNNQNPLFCCSSKELLKLASEVNHPKFGVLLDTAHLKVSCETLGLNKITEFKKLKHLIKAIHHSDNNGEIDNNERLSLSYWCGPELKDLSVLPHVIEVNNLQLESIKNQITILNNFLNDKS